MKTDKWITAKEFMDKLESDPDWVAERDARAAAHQALVEERVAEMEPLLAELRAAGCAVHSMSDLTDPPWPDVATFPSAFPVLLAHFQMDGYSAYAREWIASTLSSPDVRSRWNEIKRLFREEPDEWCRQVLANRMEAATNEELIDDVIGIVRDPVYGMSRGILLSALSRSRNPRAYAAMVDLKDDPHLAKEIGIIMKRRERRAKRRSKG